MAGLDEGRVSARTVEVERRVVRAMVRDGNLLLVFGCVWCMRALAECMRPKCQIRAAGSNSRGRWVNACVEEVLVSCTVCHAVDLIRPERAKAADSEICRCKCTGGSLYD